jgi:hypothetical protein
LDSSICICETNEIVLYLGLGLESLDASIKEQPVGGSLVQVSHRNFALLQLAIQIAIETTEDGREDPLPSLGAKRGRRRLGVAGSVAALYPSPPKT